MQVYTYKNLKPKVQTQLDFASKKSVASFDAYHVAKLAFEEATKALKEATKALKEDENEYYRLLNESEKLNK